MQKNLVSIITPLYNGEKYVSQTIESVLSQTYSNWEMIIINDGSKDKSKDIVEEYTKKDSRIKLFSQHNSGSSAARNNALRRANGKYICFLDADDIWENIFIEKQIEFIENKNAKIVFSSFKRINENNEEILRPFIVPLKVNYQSILKTCSLSCLTTLFERETFKHISFNEELRSMRDDHAFWLALLKTVDYAYGNPEILASYRIFDKSTTANKRKVMLPQFNIYYKVEKLGLLRSIYYFMHWAFNGYIKYHL